jgi:predicted transcriptional regulator
MDLTLLNKYRSELEEELDLSDFNLKDVQMRMPGIKHKWVARLIDQKIELNKLKKLKAEAVETVSDKLRKDNPVILSDAALAKQAEKHELVQKINDKIEETEVLIEYLEKVEKVCTSTSYDIKNLVDIKKLELS